MNAPRKQSNAVTGAKVKQSTISSTTEDYLVPVYKVMCLVQNVRYRGFRSLENQEFTDEAVFDYTVLSEVTDEFGVIEVYGTAHVHPQTIGFYNNYASSTDYISNIRFYNAGAIFKTFHYFEIITNGGYISGFNLSGIQLETDYRDWQGFPKNEAYQPDY